MTLLERESSLAALAQYAQEARQGDGRLVVVAGEAGVGKSALLEQFQRELSDARWSWGACDGLSTPRPLGPLFDLASQLGGELLELCQGRADREALFSALLRHLEEPRDFNVVVIEDIHWADEATLDLLRFLGRRIRGVATLLLLTYRDDALSPADPLRLALGGLASQRSTRRLALEPLSADAVRTLAGQSGLEPAELYRFTGGNPFYVTEVIEIGTSEVPPSARDAVLARAAGLSAQSRSVLAAAALVGAHVEMRLLKTVTDCAPAVVDELLASGLLVEDGTWLRFRHEIARLAVEQMLATHNRSVVHARILTALRSFDCEDDARMAFHAEGADDAPAVLLHAPRAARRATELASHREAAAQYERALRFTDDADPATVATLYAGLATEASLIDRWQDAADAEERALALWRQVGDRLREGDTMRRLARAMESLCRGADELAAAEAAVEILEPLGPTKELAQAYGALACVRMLSGKPDSSVELARRAQAIADRLDAFEVLSDTLNTEGCAIALTSQDWTGPVHRALEIALAHGLQTQVGRAYANLYGVLCDQRRYAEAQRYFADGTAYCDEHDLGTHSVFLWSTRTTVLLETGHWDEALRESTRLLEHPDVSPINRISPISRIGTIRARRGEPGAWKSLDEAITAANGSRQPQYLVPVRLFRAEAYWLEGKTDAARREAELADDESADCDAWIGGEVAVWLRRTNSTRSPRGDLPEPYRQHIEGDWQETARIWTELDCRYNAAMALLDTDDESALRRALGIFEEMGASATARVARQKMRRLGIRSIPAGPRSTTRAHPFGLTAREHQVLDLIHAGKTNVEIARTLFISTKTVDHHVSAVLAKLGTPTRDAAAAAAARLGLVGASST